MFGFNFRGKGWLTFEIRVELCGDDCVGLLLPAFEFTKKSARFFWIRFRKFVGFADILSEIKQLYGVAFEVLDEFPIAFSYDAARSGPPVHCIGSVDRDDLVVLGTSQVERVVPENGAIF